MDYESSKIESKWKKYWEENDTYKVVIDAEKPKYYILDMFPYPSGAGLHVGHPLGYIASDIIARYKRQKGYNVLHPMGFDAFGLPAEQYAIQTGVHPAVSTDTNIAKYISQLNNIGFNYDWSRSVKTSDPSYYRWTQWIFLQLFHHYYDTKQSRALHINYLIDQFNDNGNAEVHAATDQEAIFTSEEWKKYTFEQQQEILMNYRLAYKSTGYVNYCPELGTVLSNDEVKDGVSERGGHPVERKAMEQWSLRITAYAERLLTGLEQVDWSDSLKAMQRNWIGKSEGAQIFFDIKDHDDKIEIFTTRPDTIFGATFMVLAPEHDLVQKLTSEEQHEKVASYLDYVKSRSEVERMSVAKEVTGEFLGSYAINPFNNKEIPIYIAEYVLKDYGSGAIMAVPSDDDRDHAFATKYDLEIIPVVDKSEEKDQSKKDKTGKMINSGFLNDLSVKQAIAKMFGEVEEVGIGKKMINYKLRDANFSRQRYWGEPFPITYDEKGIAYPLEESELPLTLPELDDFKPTPDGKSPLAKATEWESYGDKRRETNTMPGFAGSSWYFLRYMDADNQDKFASEEALSYWQDVDLYIGGTEHAVGHLMYSRFWHKFLHDLGYVPTEEPFKRLVNQGMIQGTIENVYLKKEKEDGVNVFVSADLVNEENENEYAQIPVLIDYVQDYGSDDSYLDLAGIKSFVSWRPDYAGSIFKTANETFKDGSGASLDFKFYTSSEVGKMSKSKYNVINPDDIVEEYGADCFRMYEMFLGPIEHDKPWDTKGIDGVSKFLRKFWNLFHNDGVFEVSDAEANKDEMKILHQTIQKISDDIEKLSLNTCVSTFMVCVNELRNLKCHKRSILEPLTRLLAPFAPFITEELYELLGSKQSVHQSLYPVFEEKYLKEDTVEYPVCINGKKRDLIKISVDTEQDEIEKMVLALDSVQKWMDGKPAKKIILVPNRMINIVV